MWRRCLLLIVAFQLASPANAQSSKFLKFQQGEEVEVHYLGKWREARVLSTDRRRGVYCQYKFVSTSDYHLQSSSPAVDKGTSVGVSVSTGVGVSLGTSVSVGRGVSVGTGVSVAGATQGCGPAALLRGVGGSILVKSSR